MEKKIFILLMVMFLTWFGVTSVSANLLVNASFEEASPAGWVGGFNTYLHATQVYYAGPAPAGAGDIYGWAWGETTWGSATQIVDLPGMAGMGYTFNAWLAAYTANDDYAYITLEFFDGADGAGNSLGVVNFDGNDGSDPHIVGSANAQGEADPAVAWALANWSLYEDNGTFPAGVVSAVATIESRATNSNGNDAYVDLINLSIQNAPVLTYPVGEENQPWDLTLEWLPPSTFTPTGYYIYLDPNEEKVSSQDPTVKLNTVLDTDPNYDVTGLTHGETYYWMVVARQDPVTTPPTDPNYIPSGMGTFTTLPDTPIITLDPVSQIVPATTDVTFTVEALNATDYQWYKGTTELLGKTSATLTLENVDVADEGFYWCNVANAATPEGIDSERARLMVQRRVAKWTFENTIDASEGGFMGAYIDPNDLASAGAQFDNTVPSPAGGYAISFAGDTTESEGGTFGESVAVSDPNFFNFYPLGVTASAWVKYAQGGTWSTVAGKQHREDPTPWTGWGLIKNSADRAVFTTRQASNDVTAGGPDILTINEDLGDTWHLLTGTYDGETTRIYVDGNLENSASSTATMDVTVNPVLIGAERLDGLSPMNGLIDDLEIYNYALSRVEVAVLYTDLVPGAEVCTEDMNNDDFDFNDDCVVNLKDFAEFAAEWLECNLVPTCWP